MSGIFGYMYIGQNDRDSVHDLALLKAWHTHYGKDCIDSVNVKNAGLGCCINHFSNHFPAPLEVLNDASNYAVIDALLFNRDELISMLYTPNEIERENKAMISDEQLLYEIYIKFGSEGVAKVNGDFAGAVYNKKNKKFTLFVNHIGVRPLFYYYDGELFVFATDYRAILALPNIDKSLDEELLYRKITAMNDSESEKTVYKNIKALKPAHILNYNGNNPPELKAYWKLGAKKIRFSNDSEYTEKLYEIIEDSITRRLNVCDGPVGGELSGGLDSSVIDILINRAGRKGYYYSWSPVLEKHPLQEKDERIIIDAICRDEEIECQYRDNTNDLDEMDSYIPYDDRVDVISQAARFFNEKKTQIIFSGWGGDEGVSHRAHVLQLWHHKEYISYFKEILFYARQTKKQWRIPLRFVKTLLYQLIVLNYRFYQPWQAKNSKGEYVINVTSADFRNNVKNKLLNKPLLSGIYPIDKIETGGNRFRCESAAWQGVNEGVQYIYPYLDYRVEDYAVSIPRRMFYKNGKNRNIYVEAFKNIVPKELLDYTSKIEPGRISLLLSDINENTFMYISKLIQVIDKSKWEEYLDFDIIDDIMDKKNSNKYTQADVYAVYEALRLCYRIQKLNDMTNKTPQDINICYMF